MPRTPGIKSVLRLAATGTQAQRLSDLDGKTVLLLHEQGAGDSLQFIRYAKLLKSRAKRIIFNVPPSFDQA